MLFKLKKKEDKEMNPWSNSWLRNIYDEVIYDNQEWVGREQALALGKVLQAQDLGNYSRALQASPSHQTNPYSRTNYLCKFGISQPHIGPGRQKAESGSCPE